MRQGFPVAAHLRVARQSRPSLELDLGRGGRRQNIRSDGALYFMAGILRYRGSKWNAALRRYAATRRKLGCVNEAPATCNADGEVSAASDVLPAARRLSKLRRPRLQARVDFLV